MTDCDREQRPNQDPVKVDRKLSPSDPWKHRSDGMKCKSCMWFVPKTVKKGMTKHPVYHIGRCRRHAPTMNGYPVVFVNDWCGDHKLNEVYISRLHG